MKNLFRHFISGAVCIAMVHCAYAQRNWQARWIAYPYEMMTQPDAPGYWNWFADWGMTTFPEDWYPERSSSNNHGAFADVTACMFRYLAGFRHAMAHPGRRFLVIRPCFPEKLQDFTASHEGYEVDWRRIEGKIVFRAVVPEGCRANLILPGRKDEPLREGTHLREIEVNRQ